MFKFAKFLNLLDDMGDKLDKKIVPFYFSESKQYCIKMIVLCHKPVESDNMTKVCMDTIYMTTCKGLFYKKKFQRSS